jgi:hypothetical protein
LKRRFPHYEVAQPAPRVERLDLIAAGTDPLKRRRFGFQPVPRPPATEDGPPAPLTAEDLRRLKAAGVIREPRRAEA